MKNSDSNRLEQVEAIVQSNVKAISVLANQASEILPRIDEMQRQITNMQRQFMDNQRRIDDNGGNIRELTADIRELTLENQRILKYLESIRNKQ